MEEEYIDSSGEREKLSACEVPLLIDGRVLFTQFKPLNELGRSTKDKKVEVFRQVIKNAPYGKYAALSQYKIGLYLKEKGLFQEARDEFEKTINDYPDTEWAKAAQYQIALADAKRSTKAQYDQKVTQIAREEFEDFIKNHPETELSDTAKTHVQSLRDKEAENAFLVAAFYEKQKNLKAAKIYYNAVVADFSESVWAKKALERIQNLGKR